MATVTLRQIKGSPLTNAELDANLTNINAETVDNSTAYRLRPSLDVDLVGSKTVSPLLSFSRGSTGTYYDGKTAVKAEENLLFYSQDLSVTLMGGANIWQREGTVSATANYATAPDGTMTATRVVLSRPDTASYSRVVQHRSIVGVNTSSIWLKTTTPGTTAKVTFRTFATGSEITVTDTWQRFTATNSNINSTTAGSEIMISGATNDLAVDVLAWGAQLEQRSSATAYTPTTTSPITNYIPQLLTAPAGIPRFDHDPVTGELKGLLVEASRANLLTYSSQFDNWLADGLSVNSDQIISPDGSLTGDKFGEDTSGSTHTRRQTYTAVSGTTYTFSVFAKAAERTWIRLEIWQSDDPWVFFNLTGDGSIVNNTGLQASIVHVGNGWYRCSVTRTVSSTNIMARFGSSPSSSTTLTFVGTTNYGVYAWGAQLEAGSTPTSYIPTTTAAVTRSADQLSISKTSNWFNSVNGTLALAHDAASGQPLLGDSSTTILSSLGAGTINIDYSNSQLSVVTQSGQTNATQGIFNFDSDLQILGNSTTKANARIKYMKFYPNNVIGSTPEGSGFILDDGYAMLQEDGSVLFQE